MMHLFGAKDSIFHAGGERDLELWGIECTHELCIFRVK